jgi:glucose/arabinose dehydrogenase
MGGCRGSASVLAVVLAIGSLGACTADRTARASGGARTGSANPSAGSAVPEPTDFRNGPADRPSQGDALVSVATIARKLDVPWGVAFLPDRGALVTERRTLRILKVGPDRQANGDLTVAPLATIREADSNNEGGLLGIAASPSFARDRTVFIYYTTTVDNRIAKLRIGDRPQPIVTGLPHAGVHDGGRLAFGPDGYLYASTGDATRNDEAQHLDSLGGKILRMTVDGKPAPGNPFRDSLVWSYGHRNPEGMAWDDKGNM